MGGLLAGVATPHTQTFKTQTLILSPSLHKSCTRAHKHIRSPTPYNTQTNPSALEASGGLAGAAGRGRRSVRELASLHDVLESVEDAHAEVDRCEEDFCSLCMLLVVCLSRW